MIPMGHLGFWSLWVAYLFGGVFSHVKHCWALCLLLLYFLFLLLYSFYFILLFLLLYLFFSLTIKI